MKSKAVAVKPSTAETYATILDCHVMPQLGDFFLDKLTDKDVREWHAKLVDGMKKPTANNALRLLKMVLGDGCAEFSLPRSPAERVAKIRFHDLRHLYAAHFLMAGGSVYDLQRNLGHHSVSFTADVYGHLSQDHRVQESDRLSGLFVAPEAAKVFVLPTPTARSSRSADRAATDQPPAAVGCS
jgi:integrase